MTVTFDQLLAQAQVSLSPKGLYLAKEHRSCDATARLFVAIRAMLDTANADASKHEVEKTSLAKENSKLAAKLATAERERSDLQRLCFARGLESTDLPESTRTRLLSTNAA